jgi:hypothetical protein
MERKISVGINDFVLRQTAESPFSYFKETWEKLIELVQLNFHLAEPGNKDGIILVPMLPSQAVRFATGLVKITPETRLRTVFKARREGEESYPHLFAYGVPKAEAKQVRIVLYRHDVLAADNEASGDADWEIVSINASPVTGREPLTPAAMMRNQLGLPGGTLNHYSSEEWACATRFWNEYAMWGGMEVPKEN